MESEDTALRLLASALDAGEWLRSPPGIHLIWVWVGPRVGLDAAE
jgi:hypothetical protein